MEVAPEVPDREISEAVVQSKANQSEVTFEENQGWSGESDIDFDVDDSTAISDLNINPVTDNRCDYPVTQAVPDKTQHNLKNISAEFTGGQGQCLKFRPFGSGSGRLGLKIPPGRGDLGRKFSRPGRFLIISLT